MTGACGIKPHSLVGGGNEIKFKFVLVVPPKKKKKSIHINYKITIFKHIS